MTVLRWTLNHNPAMVISMAGTVGISSVGMFGKDHSGWGISSGTHGLDLVVGGTALKPAIADGRIEPRHLLSLAIIFDHEFNRMAMNAAFSIDYLHCQFCPLQFWIPSGKPVW
jgi:hypothetical protein